MKVYGKCNACSNEIGYFTLERTRVDFAMRVAENKTLQCKKCATKTEFHVDELYAKPSNIAQIVACLIFVIGTLFLVYLFMPFSESEGTTIYVFGGFLTVPVVVYILIKKQEQTRVNAFNRSKLKGRISNIR